MASLCHRAGAYIGAILIVIIAIATPAHASPYDEFVGIRAEAMGGAHRGLGTSNDAILLNPAGIALFRRYSIDTVYAYSGADSVSHIHASAVDSKTGPISGALGYTYSRGDHSRSDVDIHRIYVASAYPILENVAFGLLARHIRGVFREENRIKQNVESFSTDAGLSIVLFNALGIGVTYHNIVTSSRKRFNPPHLGFGLAYSSESLAIATDLEVDLRKRRLGDITFRAGLEYFLADSFPLRFGYRLQPWTRKRDGVEDLESVLGGGVGWVTESGAVEVTYTQSVNVKKNWDLLTSLKFYL